jgi:hypothetical protein
MYIIIWLVSVLVLVACWIFRGYIFNGFYTMAVIADCFKNFFCQLWIDAEKLFKLFKRKKKAPEMDDTSDFYHLD